MVITSATAAMNTTVTAAIASGVNKKNCVTLRKRTLCMWWEEMQRSAHSKNLDYINTRSDSIFIEWIVWTRKNTRSIWIKKNEKEQNDHGVEASKALSHYLVDCTFIEFLNFFTYFNCDLKFKRHFSQIDNMQMHSSFCSYLCIKYERLTMKNTYIIFNTSE